MTDWRRRAGTAAWLVVGGVSLLVLAGAALAVVGYAAGGPEPPPGEPPAVDHGEPPAEVTADALAQLRYRDHAWDWWLRSRNLTTGERGGGVVLRVTVEHSERRLRVTSWGTATLGARNETVTPDRRPDYTLFGNRLLYRSQRGRPADAWRRTRRAGLDYEHSTLLFVDDPARLRGANVSVVAENGSALVARTTDPRALAAFDPLFRYRTNASATVVVTKGADPHVARVVLHNRSGPVTRTETFHVREVGTAEASRPEPAPPWTVTEVFARVLLGLERLFG